MTLRPLALARLGPFALALLLASGSALVVSSCAPGDRPSSFGKLGDRRLDSAEPLGGGSIVVESCGETKTVALDAEQLVCRGRSWRRSLVTTDGASWSIALPELEARRRLEVSVAALESGGQKDAARLEWTSSGQVVGKVAVDLAPAEDSGGWQRQSFDVPPGVDGVRMQSAAPVAWAERYLVGDPEAAGPETPPSVVLIVLDTLRAESLGLYGHERATSPQMQRLARDAWLFPHSLSASTCTQPSTSSLLSGLAPLQHGVRAGKVLPESAETFVEALRDAGYRTAAITDGGFVAPNWGFAQGFDRYDATGGDAWLVKDAAPIVASATAWLERNRFEPFFLLVHTYETHMPYVDPEGFAADYLDPDYEGPYREKGVIKLEDLAGLRDVDRQRLRDLYDGEVRRADHYVGRLLEALDEMGLYDRVGLLLTSDHGEEFFEYGGAEHGFGRVYDPHVRVPMLVKEPGAPRGAGGRRLCPASGLDVAPTLLDMAGLPAPEGWLGRSLLTCDKDVAEDIAGGVDVAPRPILAHGLSAFPKQTELERFRLDRGTRSVHFDRGSGLLQAFELAPDGTLGSKLESIDEEARLAFEHLQAMLAWSAAPYLVRLDIADGELIVPAGSRFRPLGVYDGFLRVDGQPRGEAVHFELRTGGPVYLLAEIGPGEDFELLHEADGEKSGEARRLPITTRTPGGDALDWRPLGEDLPPFWVIFEGAPGLEAETRQMTAEEEAELRSLGYL